MRTIKAAELSEGTAFRRPGQRKWRVASTILPVPGRLTDDGEPGVLVCLRDCSQIVLSVGDEVELPEKEHDMDGDGFVKLGRIRRKRNVVERGC